MSFERTFSVVSSRDLKLNLFRCDKIQGDTIPINHARPNRNIAITRREPICVCGLVTPWNYPLMMLSWKMAACLAAGNTVVIKPAAVCPLTALKFAELSHKAGIPPGVINVLTGSGSVAGKDFASASSGVMASQEKCSFLPCRTSHRRSPTGS